MCTRRLARLAARTALVIATVIASACAGARPITPRVGPAAPRVTRPREIRVRVGTRVTTVAFEDYVAGTALSEIVPVNETAPVVDRVYDVQTIIARTYALAHLGRHRTEGFDLCDTTHCQVYEPGRLGTSRFAGDVRRAVGRTAGQVLEFGGRPIDALFSADCGGHSTIPAQVWGTAPVPYLRVSPDRAPGLTHRSWAVRVSVDDLRTALNGDPRTSIGRTLRSVTPEALDSSGRVSSVVLVGDRRVAVRADDFRQIVNRVLGPRGILSTRFTLTREGSVYLVQGTGFGHGVGLCQVGAVARARQHATINAILANYFPGARVVRVDARIP
jgi:stage II sporulation protein D